ncbi:MAG TPA: transporter [Nitrospirota bacterium]
MKRCLLGIITSLFVLLPFTSYAAGLCCQLSSGVQESLSGVVAPGAEQLSLQLNYSFTSMDKFREGSSSRSLNDIKASALYASLPVSMDMFKYTLTAGYGFTPKFKVFVSIPYVRNTMDMTSFNMMMGSWMGMTMTPVHGLGDITVMGLYRLSTNREIRPTDAVTLGFGVKTPTGSYTEKKPNGTFVHAHMQPGTGSWDPLLSLIYTKMIDQFVIQSNATYELATRNNEGYKFGDSLALDFAGTYTVVREFNVTAGLTFLNVNKASDKDGKYTNLASLLDDPANTGGESLWFSPGVQILPFKNSMIDFKYQVPVWEKVNGVQLVSSYRYVLGMSYSF